MRIAVGVCRTAWGWVGMATSSAGLLGTTLPRVSRERTLARLLDRWPGAQEGADSRLAALHGKLCRYFDGEAVGFGDQVLDLRRATDFQVRVWKAVRSIPRGQVRSYGWVADVVGSTGGARAVGQAMAANPFPIIVPCHRVVGKDGRLTGFAAGLGMKRRLLELEGVPPGNPTLTPPP